MASLATLTEFFHIVVKFWPCEMHADSLFCPVDTRVHQHHVIPFDKTFPEGARDNDLVLVMNYIVALTAPTNFLDDVSSLAILQAGLDDGVLALLRAQ